jgi:hypothetical protein
MPRLTFGRHAAGALPPSTDLVRLGRCRRILRGVTPYSLFSAHERTAQGLGQVGALRKSPNKHALRTLVLASGVWTTPMTAKRRNESGKTPGLLHHVDSTRLSKSAINSTRRLGLGQTTSLLPIMSHYHSVPHTRTSCAVPDQTHSSAMAAVSSQVGCGVPSEIESRPHCMESGVLAVLKMPS